MSEERFKIIEEKLDSLRVVAVLCMIINAMLILTKLADKSTHSGSSGNEFYTTVTLAAIIGFIVLIVVYVNNLNNIRVKISENDFAIKKRIILSYVLSIFFGFLGFAINIILIGTVKYEINDIEYLQGTKKRPEIKEKIVNNFNSIMCNGFTIILIIMSSFVIIKIVNSLDMYYMLFVISNAVTISFFMLFIYNLNQTYKKLINRDTGVSKNICLLILGALYSSNVILAFLTLIVIMFFLRYVYLMRDGNEDSSIVNVE